MGKFRDFMQGRYGYDKLGLYIIITSIVLSVIGKLLWYRPLNLLCVLLDLIFIYRFLSRKEYARSRENRIFLEFIDKLKNCIQHDKQSKRYKCPVCKTKFSQSDNQFHGYTAKIICPKCGNEF